MYEYNEHIDKDTKNSNDNPLKIDKNFLDELSKFIQSVESEIDIMLPGSASLQFLWYYKIIDYIISQKLAKNIIIRLLCPLDENSARLTKQLVPFIGYRSINLSLPNTPSNSLFFIRDNQDIFSFSIERQQQQQHDNNKDSDTIFSANNWSYSNDISIVRNAIYCFDLIWEEKENHDKTIKEKKTL